MSRGKFERSDILVRHGERVISNMEEIVKQTQRPNHYVNMSMKKTDGIRLERLLWLDESLHGLMRSNKYNNEFQHFADSEVELLKPLVISFDYIFKWLSLTNKHLSEFANIAQFLDIKWALPATLRILKLFTYYCRVVFLIYKARMHLMYTWYICRISDQWMTIDLQSNTTEVNTFFVDLDQRPLKLIAERLEFMEKQLGSMLPILCPVFTQITGAYITFDWSTISYQLKDDKMVKGSMPSNAHIVFQYMNLFKDTLIWMFLVFPHMFAANSRYRDLMTVFISDCGLVHLGNKMTSEIKEFYELPGSSTELRQIFTKTQTNDELEKMKQARFGRIRILCALLEEYEDHIKIDETVIALYMDELLAILGFGYSELMTCFDLEMRAPEMITLLGFLMRFVQLVEDNAITIQRIYLFNVARLDLPYMSDLLTVFGRKCSASTQKVITQICGICEALEQMDLVAFDNGVRYDLTPMFITHGRIIHYAYRKSVGEGIGYLNPLLEHMTTIRRHTELCENPLAMVLKIAPLGVLSKYMSEILVLLAKSHSYSQFLSVLLIFKLIPATKETSVFFDKFLGKLVSMIIERLSGLISVQSKNIQISRQASMDIGFKPEAFMPQIATQLSDYEHDSSQFHELSGLISLVCSGPSVLVHGTTKFAFKERFISGFLPVLAAKVLEGNTNPMLIQATIIAMHTFVPIFKACGVPFYRSLANMVRSASQLPGDGLLDVQYKTLAGIETRGVQAAFIKVYTEFLQAFIKGGHVTSRYEPLGRRFVGNSPTQKSWGSLFALRPMTHLIQTFGLSASVQINSVLMEVATESIVQIISIFDEMKPVLSKQEFDFYNDNTISCSALGYRKQIKTAAQALLQIGLTQALRHMLGDAIHDSTNDIFPGFHDIVKVAYIRCADNLSLRDIAFVETLDPGSDEYFLVKRLEDSGITKTNPTQFMFFLAMLFTNFDWNDLRFQTENDLFTHNLHLLPLALELICQLGETIFSKYDIETATSSLRFFFSVLRAIADDKRTRNYDMYCSFVILVDHFPAFAPSIPYGLIEHAFPYIITRSCYEHMSQQKQETDI